MHLKVKNKLGQDLLMKEEKHFVFRGEREREKQLKGTESMRERERERERRGQKRGWNIN